jgi:ABC-type uncharacterized transport system involved in gliding motility auxiliary subunit
MNTRHDQPSTQGEPPNQPARQQQQQPQGESHAGQGAESVMKQLRVWEQNRASNSGGPGRERPG